jgi:ATP-binding cassette subfamily B protein
MRTLGWPGDRFPDAVAALARASHVGPDPDVRAVDPDLSTLSATPPALAPAVLRVRVDGTEQLVAVARARRRRLVVVTPDGDPHSVRTATVEAWMRAGAESGGGSPTALRDLVARSGGRPGRLQRATIAGLGATTRTPVCWVLQPRGEPLRGRARELGLAAHARRFLLTHLAQYALWIASWWAILALAQRADFGDASLTPVILILATLIGCRAVEGHAARMLALGGGTVIRRRFLASALDLRHDDTQRAGIGRYLGRMLEVEAIDTAGLAGAFQAGSALMGVVVATVVLAHGAGGWLHALLFAGWTAGLVAWSAVYYLRRRRGTDLRFKLTAVGVEQMEGHQTRLAQEHPAHRHDVDDELLERYVKAQQTLDAAATAGDLWRRAWTFIGVFGLAGAFASPGPSPSAFIVAIGGVVVGAQALASWTDSVPRLAAAAIALRGWGRFGTREASHSATRVASAGEWAADGAAAEPVLEARDLSFTYPRAHAPVVDKGRLSIGPRDHILLEGPSGSGKSTFAALLAGLRDPDGGLLLLRGLDRATIGDERWRRNVVLAPQFQDNHVLVGTLAYNLLLGRGWPPTRADLAEADDLCRAPGLGPLLDRMPLGLHQPVGETGWWLSHGERSRVFAARAILQKPAVLVLDESFAALDPATLAQTLRLVIDQRYALVMIAHP